MSLQFVLGSSGSGKTTVTYQRLVEEAAKNPKKNYLFLVPEQFTLQTQQKLVDLAPGHVIVNIDVLSFKRLAYRVFDDLGITDISVLEETGKNLILRKVAEEEKEHLTVMRPNMARIGYIEEVKSLISELSQYNVTPDRLEAYASAGSASPAFAAKLMDVVTMYRGFCAHMQENSLITAEEILSRLIAVAEQSALLRDSVVVLDDFTGFTPIQNQLLRRILPMVDRMYILLTIDKEEDPYHLTGEQELFALTKKTVIALSRMAEELGVTVEQPVFMDGTEGIRFALAKDLAFLEQHLFRSSTASYAGEVAHIDITSHRNPYEELVSVVREIDALVRQGRYRYRDIAVVTGDVETYSQYARLVFAQYEIPCFIDQSAQVLFHPFLECLRGALEILGENFSYPSMMRFLRCGYVDLEESSIDELDNFLYESGIRGRSAWEHTWLRRSRKGYDMEILEACRVAIMDLLLPLADAFAGGKQNVGQEVMAVYTLLCKLSAGEKLLQQAAAHKEVGEDARYHQDSQIYQTVMELLEKFHYLFRDEQMDIDEFVELLDAGLSAAKVAVLPPAFDSVTIGDIERTRLDDVKVLYILGVNDGIVPKASGAGGIISEYERQMLQEADLELAPGAREQAFIQRFYLYRNLTKPSESLHIHYSRVDAEGKAMRESYLVGVLQKMFPTLTVTEKQEIGREYTDATPQAALTYLTCGLRDEKWYALAHCLLATEEYHDLMEAILTAPFARYQNNPVSKAVAHAIYGRQMEGSVTRLEKFARCAYSHFLDYGLGLKERKEPGMTQINMGNLSHDALRRYSENLRKQQLDWNPFSRIWIRHRKIRRKKHTFWVE